MNLNQAAHGDREFGYVQSRLGVAAQDRRRARRPTRWSSGRVAAWARAALGRAELRDLRLARFGDNMRDVAVTEGDKVEAQLRFGVSVNTYGVNDLVAVVDAVAGRGHRRARRGVRRPLRRRARARCPAESGTTSLRYGARIEAGPAHLPRGRRLRGVHHQLRGPRRAAAAARPRRPAADGRRLRVRRRGRLEDLGAAARHEGDGCAACPAAPRSWRTTPTTWCPGEEKILGAHMLEVCPSITAQRAVARDPSAGDRRPRGPGPAAVRRRPRPGGGRRAVRPR